MINHTVVKHLSSAVNSLTDLAEHLEMDDPRHMDLLATMDKLDTMCVRAVAGEAVARQQSALRAAAAQFQSYAEAAGDVATRHKNMCMANMCSDAADAADGVAPNAAPAADVAAADAPSAPATNASMMAARDFAVNSVKRLVAVNLLSISHDFLTTYAGDGGIRADGILKTLVDRLRPFYPKTALQEVERMAMGCAFRRILRNEDEGE